MEIMRLVEESDEMIKEFVNNLGFDGQYYTDSNRCPVMYASLFAPGMFLSAHSKQLKKRLDKTNLDEKVKNKILDTGLILIDREYRNKKADANLFVTYIHEKFHANRMLLINTNNKETEDIDAIFYDNGKFATANNSTNPTYVDPAQDVLLGSVDDSKQTTKKYEDMTVEEREDLSFANEEYEAKMAAQQNIDESLVETMAIATYKMHKDKETDILSTIQDINEHYKDDDIHAITNIILRHNDLDLFRWMIDPLTYQNNDIHYDFFSNYVTEEDKADVEKITNSEELLFTEDFIDYNIKKNLSK